MRSVHRFVEYKTVEDPTGEKWWKAVCVSGAEADCGETSPKMRDDETANEWMAEHTAGTGHGRFNRLYSDFAIVERKA